MDIPRNILYAIKVLAIHAGRFKTSHEEDMCRNTSILRITITRKV